MSFSYWISRRSLLLGGGAMLVGTALPPLGLRAATETVEKELIAAPGQASLPGGRFTRHGRLVL